MEAKIKDEKWVEVSIEDNGDGIPEEALEQIFCMDKKKCEKEKTGDYCITNNCSERIFVRINDVSSHSPLSKMFRTISINAHSKSCFYDLDEGNYLALVIRGKNQYDLTDAEPLNIRVRPCMESTSTVD